MSYRQEITSARDLPRELVTPITDVVDSRYVKHGDARGVWDYSGHYEEITPADASVWSYGQWRDSDTAEATYFVIRHASYSDYSGSTVEASNYRSLLRDFPGAFVECVGGYGTRALLLPAEMPATFCPEHPETGDSYTSSRAEMWTHLLSELASLADYPLYDEQDHSELEMTLADEAWDAYLRYDVRRALETDHGIDNADDISEESLREQFYRITGESSEPYYAESAIDIVFPKLSETVAELARLISAGELR